MRLDRRQAQGGHAYFLQTVFLAALACGLLLGVGTARAASYGLAGSFDGSSAQNGPFSRPHDLAVDQSTGDVYVTDQAQFEVEKFDSSGNFLLAFGKGVDHTTGADVCVEGSGDVCGAGVAGSETAQFGGTFTFGCFCSEGQMTVAVDQTTHDIYVVDGVNNRVEYFDSTGSYLGQFDGSSTPASAFSNPRGVAVDSSSDVYVVDAGNNVIDKFSSTGAYQSQITGSETPPGEFTFSQTPEGLGGNLAIDSSGDLYVADRETRVVDKFSPAGTYLTRVASGPASAVAVDASGDIFVAEGDNSVAGGEHIEVYGPTGLLIADFGSGTISSAGNTGGGSYGLDIANSTGAVYIADGSSRAVWIFSPVVAPTCSTEGPAIDVTSTSATVPGTVNPNGTDTTYSFQYGLDTGYSGGSTPSADAGSGTGDVPVTGALSGLQPNQTYHYQLAVSFGAGNTNDCGDQVLSTLPAKPSIDGESTTGETQTDAILQAQINPNNQETTYQFQYGTDTNYTGGTIPAAPGTVGSGYGDQSASTDIGGGLAANTTYHFRVVATNATGTTDGPDQTFVTLPNPPTATTGGASSVAQTSATVAGTVNGQNADTHYLFSYGTDAGYGSITSPGDAGIVATDTPVSADLSGLTPNTTYHYQLVACNVSFGVFGSSVGCSPPSNFAHGVDQAFTTLPLAPGVNTGLASGVAATTASVHGSINPQGADTDYHLEYGTDTTYAQSTSEADAGSGSGGQPVAVTLSALAPDTIYHYRFVATNSGGTTYGKDQTLTTYGVAPAVTTGQASGIAQTTATLNGHLDPQGSDTTYSFQYGTSTHYGANAPAPRADAGSGEGAESVSAGLTGLSAGTTYHFRLVGVNASGVGVGADRTFTTAAAPPATASPSQLPPKPPKCRKGFFKKHGNCVKKPHRKKKAHRKHRNRHAHKNRRA